MKSKKRADSLRQREGEGNRGKGRRRLEVGALAAILLCALLPSPAAAAAAPSGWEGATSIEVDNGGVFAPSVGGDAQGNFVAVWYQFGNLYSNRYAPGHGWGSAGLIETNDTAFVRYPSMAVSDSGDAVAAWVYPGSGGPDHVYANGFSPTTGWGLPVEIHPGATGYMADMSVAINGAGSAFAVWDESGAGFITDIWAARFTPSGGWEPPEIIDTGADYAFAPDVSMDNLGNAVAAWAQVNGSYEEMQAARYGAGGGWGAPQTLAHNDSADELGAQVALSSAGDALVVWNEVGTDWNILGSSYLVDVGWQPPAQVEHRQTGRAELPQVAMDAFDSGCAVWLEVGVSGARDAWQNCYDKGVGWGQEALLEHDDVNAVVLAFPAVNIAMDDSGNAIATWAQSDGVEQSAWASARVNGRAWGAPALLETLTGGGAGVPAVGMSAAGSGMAVWGQDVTVNSRVMANHYLVPDVTPPFLVVSSPAGALDTNVSSLVVSGFTEPGARVVVNGLEAAVASDGSFSVVVALQPGVNLLKVEANDASGIRTTVYDIITYEDPVPGLEAQLADAQAALNVSRAEVAALAELLSASQANLTATEADVNATQDNVTAAQAALAQAQAALAAAQARESALGAELATLRANATAEQSRITALESSSAASNASAQAAQGSAQGARDQAAGASTMALLGVLLGFAGLAVGALAVIRGGRGGGPSAARGAEPVEKKEIVGEGSPKKPE